MAFSSKIAFDLGFCPRFFVRLDRLAAFSSFYICPPKAKWAYFFAPKSILELYIFINKYKCAPICLVYFVFYCRIK